MMENWKLDRIGSCERGENPTLLMRMKSGFAVMADSQFLPGYCILLACPKAGSINELSMSERAQFLLDMSLIGDSIIQTCTPLRLNYSIMANTDHYLHAHIQARYDWEPEEHKCIPAWSYPEEQFYGREYEYTVEKHGGMKSKIQENLKRLMEQSNY